MPKHTPVLLDIDELPDLLYDYLLEEFQTQHGFDGSYTNWKITATKITESFAEREPA